MDESKPTREGLKYRYSRFVPLEAIAAASASFEYGANKYSARNWEKGLPWQTMIDSLKRHVEDFERGNDYDDGPEGSGLPHVCMIMASAMMLTATVMRGIGTDDRIKKLDYNEFTAKDCAKWIVSVLEEAEQRRSNGNKTE